LVVVEAVYAMEKLKHFSLVEQLLGGLEQGMDMAFDSLPLDVRSETE